MVPNVDPSNSQKKNNETEGKEKNKNTEKTNTPDLSDANFTANEDKANDDSKPSLEGQPTQETIKITLPSLHQNKASYINEKNFIGQCSVNIKNNETEFVQIKKTNIIASKINLNEIEYNDDRGKKQSAKIFITSCDFSYSKIIGLASIDHVNFTGADVSNLKFFPKDTEKNKIATNEFLNLLKNNNPEKYQNLNLQQGISWNMIYDAVTSNDETLNNSAIQLLKNINIIFNNKTKFLNDPQQNKDLYDALRKEGKRAGFYSIDKDTITEALKNSCSYNMKAQDVINDKDRASQLRGNEYAAKTNQINAIKLYIKENNNGLDCETLTYLANKLDKNPDSVFHGTIKKEDKKFFIIGDKEKNEPSKIFVFEVEEQNIGKSFFWRTPLKERNLCNPCKLFPEEILANFVWGYECELIQQKNETFEGEATILCD